MANHHLIPEEIMKKPRYAKMFNKLRSMDFNDDGASNGVFLPGSKKLTQNIDLPGHWSDHAKYTKIVETKVSALNDAFRAGKISDAQLVLGIGKIQSFARENLTNNTFVVDTITERLL
ncbi:AHH domain-containing protein [Pseudomonas putida]|nr:AHH domain-containing protein [Pseudomonas putida]